MARKRRRSSLQAGELNLTAMIDVAFQLLSFFIISSHPQDVISTLDVFRPSADPSAASTSTPNMIRVQVLPGAYTINDKVVAVEELDRLLAKLASIDKNQTIMIMCSQSSKHAEMISVLDICAKNGLVNLSVVSMK